MNYYNEHDKYAAAWLRELIAAGHIAPGIVDERSIEDVRPDELAGYTQCHFFAGIGVWSYALRQAGWPDDRPVWTGSCPCQPFSAAGKGDGFDDERHLWPAFHHLIAQCRPSEIFGEQVASKAVDPWIDLVHADLEALGYAFGSVPFPSAGVGAPHIRDRNYWVANADSSAGGQGSPNLRRRLDGGYAQSRPGLGGGSMPYRLDNTDNTRPQGHTGHGGATGWPGPQRPVAEAGVSGGVANAELQSGCAKHERQSGQRIEGSEHITELGSNGAKRGPGPTNGLWADADWLFCRDGKWRPVSPGTFPLVTGAPARVGRLRAYGNAINASAAEVFIRSVMESTS